MPNEDYRTVAARAQQKVLDAIPSKWKLPNECVKREGDGYAPIELIERTGILTKQQLDITQLTASQVLKAIHSGALTAFEATEAFCARTAIAHQLVNCLVDFYPDEALADAKALDEEFARTQAPVGPLHGLPVPIKDIHHVRDKVVTMGWLAWVDNDPSTTDSSTVKVLRDAGAIIFARTTCPQTGMALETVSNLWGRTLNAYNIKFGSGGSSGGDGVLVALRGAPAAPLSTDIGGSIRTPGAFNGLYAFRPTADRVPKTGMLTCAPGNASIKVSVGPNCHSMEDVELFTRLILTHPTLPYEPTATMGWWNPVPETPKKLRIGLWATDGVVDPHPPISRALRETAAKLQVAGHEVVDFVFPFDLWEAALTTWALYFQTGAKEHKALLEAAGEPPIAQFAHNLAIFETKELSVSQLFRHNTKQAEYKAALQKAWDESEVDCIVCPAAPMAGVPHDFTPWWGYTSIWNLVDYPSVIVPVKEFRINSSQDPKDEDHVPRENPFDKQNWQLCKLGK